LHQSLGSAVYIGTTVRQDKPDASSG